MNGVHNKECQSLRLRLLMTTVVCYWYYSVNASARAVPWEFTINTLTSMSEEIFGHNQSKS
jgi:hypothetical protein